MRIPIYERISGTTFRATYVNSGVSPALLSSLLRDANEAVVNTAAAASSGNGFYYAVHQLPTTPGWFVNEWISVIGVNTYIDRQFVRGVHPET